MNLKFSYSQLQEFKEVLNMSLHKSEYLDLRSVVWPTAKNLINFAVNSNKYLEKIQTLWINHSEDINKAFSDLGLKDLGFVICYIHGISCEGWFDVDTNSIHIRTVRSGGNNEILDTIIHELLHLATYKKDLTYEEREKIVDEYLQKPQFSKLLK